LADPLVFWQIFTILELNFGFADNFEQIPNFVKKTIFVEKSNFSGKIQFFWKHLIFVEKSNFCRKIQFLRFSDIFETMKPDFTQAEKWLERNFRSFQKI